MNTKITKAVVKKYSTLGENYTANYLQTLDLHMIINYIYISYQYLYKADRNRLTLYVCADNYQKFYHYDLNEY